MVVLAKTFDLDPELGQIQRNVPLASSKGPISSLPRDPSSLLLRTQAPIRQIADKQVYTPVREPLHHLQAVAVEEEHSCVVSRRKFRLSLFVGTGVDFNNETPSTPASQFPPLAQGESFFILAGTWLRI
jgi:hypothetical protein